MTSNVEFERDRARDALLVARGYLVMRFSYRRVIDEIEAGRTGDTRCGARPRPSGDDRDTLAWRANYG